MRPGGLVLLAVVAGCGRVAFDPLVDGGPGAGDGRGGDATPLCASWGPGGGPIEIPEFIGQPSELDPSFGSIDELWVSEQNAGYDLFTYQRDSGGAYVGRTAFPFNSASNDGEPALTTDALDLMFMSDRGGALRVYETTRPAFDQ